TVDVQFGTVSFDDGSPQFAGNTLTGGEWIVRQFAALSAPNATNITINKADVTLDGLSSNFGKFNSLANNQGSFTITDGRDFTTTGNLTNSGTITAGPESALMINGNFTQSAVNHLASWWQGEGNANDSADASHINGVLNGNTSFAAGQFGQAFSFDGNGDFVSFGNPTDLRLQDFTISAWVKRDNLAKSGQIFGYGQSGYGFGIFDDGKMFLTQVGINHVQTSDLALTDTDFHHVSVTRSGGTVTFYLDGIAEVVGPYQNSFSFFTNAAIGSRSDSTDPFWAFEGRIDEVAVFSRALTAVEVNALRSSNNPVLLGNQPPRIQIDVAGRPRSGKFGEVKATGQATLLGTLLVNRREGFGPSPNDSYRVLSYASRSGTFAEIDDPGPFFDAAVNATNVTLNVRPDVPTYDLAAIPVSASGTARPGELITIPYTVQNLSNNGLAGPWFDSIYLSS
ncbi:MAG TPA: LamG domain-containing protein, partial [Pirellulaceae bacterium]